MIKIEYIKSKCNSCGYCYDFFAERWYYNEVEGKAELFGAELLNDKYILQTTNDEYEINTKIAKMCTGKAIKVFNQKK